jgi:ABC-2 type transport system permease protein
VSLLLRGELLKLRTTRTFVALVGVTLALSLLVVVLTTVLSNDIDPQDARDLFSADFTGLFIMLLGVIGMAGEWRHRTITGTVLAAPNRLALMAAKMLAYAAAGVVLSLIVTATIMLVGNVILSSRGLDTVAVSDLLDTLWRNLLVAALVGALGVGIGALVRNQVVAIIGVLVLGFVVEPALFGLAPDVARFGPTQGAPAGIQDIEFFGEDGDQTLSPSVATLVMLGWIALFFAAAGVRLRSRDLV